eukprot:751389-Hanusia_phi.AAC.4
MKQEWSGKERSTRKRASRAMLSCISRWQHLSDRSRPERRRNGRLAGSRDDDDGGKGNRGTS